MIKRIGALLGVVSLSACVSVQNIPLSDDASAQLQGKSVTRTYYPTANFAAMTAGKAMFGAIGAAAMISAGNSIVQENGIRDPAVAISQRLAMRLVATRNIGVVPTQTVADSDDVSALVSTYPSADLLLDVKTLNWMFSYYPSDWTHYRITYSARVRLIDTANKKVTAETMCQTVQGDDANPPTKDQLLENKAALLKSYLDHGVSACVELLEKNLLRI